MNYGILLLNILQFRMNFVDSAQFCCCLFYPLCPLSLFVKKCFVFFFPGLTTEIPDEQGPLFSTVTAKV